MSLFLQTLVLRGILFREQEHRLEEFHTKKILIQYGICALAVALMMPLAQAQPAGLQAAFGEDAGTLSDKFTALARRIVGISGTVRNFGVPVEARQSLIMPELC